MKIPISKPSLGEAEAQAAGRAILSGWVTQGPEVKAFEEEFAQTVGASHACAVSSCTTALHLALLAAGVGPGDEVITVSHSFIATANAIVYCGAQPVFIDIEPDTFNMDPALIERAVTDKTRAILCVHQIGMPCDLSKILPIAGKHKLPVIEDAACAIGSEIRWQGQWEKIGKPHGDIACFSFHPRKVITTGDGGMITTSNADWDKKFRLWRQQSMSVPDTVRHQSSRVIIESYPELGFNYRLTDIQAAVGREQLKRLPEIVQRRRDLAKRYQEGLQSIPGIGVPQEPEWARSNWQSYCVRLPPGANQQEIMQTMLDKGVSTKQGIMCAHRQDHFSQPAPLHSLKKSEQAQDHCLLLPLFFQLTDQEQDFVIQILQEILVRK